MLDNVIQEAIASEVIKAPEVTACPFCGDEMERGQHKEGVECFLAYYTREVIRRTLTETPADPETAQKLLALWNTRS
jgi:hypothetical protein